MWVDSRLPAAKTPNSVSGVKFTSALLARTRELPRYDVPFKAFRCLLINPFLDPPRSSFSRFINPVTYFDLSNVKLKFTQATELFRESSAMKLGN